MDRMSNSWIRSSWIDTITNILHQQYRWLKQMRIKKWGASGQEKTLPSWHICKRQKEWSFVHEKLLKRRYETVQHHSYHVLHISTLVISQKDEKKKCHETVYVLAAAAPPSRMCVIKIKPLFDKSHPLCYCYAVTKVIMLVKTLPDFSSKILRM